MTDSRGDRLVDSTGWGMVAVLRVSGREVRVATMSDRIPRSADGRRVQRVGRRVSEDSSPMVRPLETVRDQCLRDNAQVVRAPERDREVSHDESTC